MNKDNPYQRIAEYEKKSLYSFENEHDVFVGVNYSKEKMYNFLT